MRFFILLIFLFSHGIALRAQLSINEASCRNASQIQDSRGKYHDWIEIYNAGNEEVSLYKYSLSDDISNLSKWVFPFIRIPARQYMVIFASGEAVKTARADHFETAVRDDDSWRWINPTAATPTDWMRPGFNDQSWKTGPGGFGFGDGDERTLFGSDKISVYTRITFMVTDSARIISALLNVDYDDGFIAYLNGIEIARANMEGPGQWNSLATASHEAVMYQSQNPELFTIDPDLLRLALREGENVLAVQAHNNLASSSDMSLRAFLSFGMIDEKIQFGPTPIWFHVDNESGIYTNFKLSRKGETIFLSDHRGVLVDELTLPAGMPVNFSFGNVTDGSSDEGFFKNGTPGRANRFQKAYTKGFEPEPTADVQGGFYSTALRVALSVTSPTGEIRYTLNGPNPDEQSALYTGPLSIDSTTILKAACFGSTGSLPGPIMTHTYFINANPTPAGVLSLSMDNEDLYGAGGIYDNWWTDWKKPCFMEYYAPNSHQLAFRQAAGIKIDGGAGGSRSNAQRSFRVEPGNGTFGDGDVEYPLIPSRKGRASYENFYLRNGSNQHLFYPCKDAIETRCMGDSTLNTYAAYTPVQVYLNGTYWGYYELREKLDTDYFLQNYRIDKDSVDILSVSYFYGGELRNVTDGDGDPKAQFNKDYSEFLTLDTKSPDFWARADSLFDLEYYTDYICAQSWIADVDWPYNNIRIYRGPETGWRWRFSLIDLELALDPNGWQNATFDHIEYMKNYDPSFPYVHIWQQAMKNDRYHDYFINRYADLMNTAWRKDRLWAIANEIYTETRPELLATYARWGDQAKSPAAYLQEFDQAHKIMLNELSARSRNVRNHIRANFSLPQTVVMRLEAEPAGSGYIRISTVMPDVYPWFGTWFSGVPVRIEAIPAPGFVFEKWGGNSLLKDVANPVFLDTLRQSATFKAFFKPGNFSEQIIISELNYNSDPLLDSDDWIEFHNADSLLPASLNGWYFTDKDSTHRYTFLAEAIIEPGGYLVIARDIVRFKARYPDIEPLGGLDFGFGAGGDAVWLYNDKKIPVEGFTYETQAPWPAGADGQGFTLERQKPAGDPSNPLSWFAGCPGGSPGRAYIPCHSGIGDKEGSTGGINVFPNPLSDVLQISVVDHKTHKIELYNSSGRLVRNLISASQVTMISVRDLPDGLYVVVIYSDKGAPVTRRVVKAQIP